MKRNITLITLLLIFSLQLFAQSPQKINYQGVARDLKGNAIGNQKMKLKLEIINSLDATLIEYSETQIVETNSFGLYSLQIGNGQIIEGDFKTIKWETGTKYIRVFIDAKGGNEFDLIGTTQLLSVPYALYADKAGIAKEVAETGKTRTGTVSTSSTGTGTANYITKFTAANTIYNSSLYDNGNIGLGTTSPVGKLHIKNTAASNTEFRIQHTSTSAASRISFFNDTTTAFTATANYAIMNKYGSAVSGSAATKFPLAKLFGFNNSQGSLLFSSGGNVGFGRFNQSNSTVSVKIFIDSATGYVGINNTSPTSNLHVLGTELTTGLFTSAGVDNTTGILKSQYTGTTIDDHIAIYGKSQPSLSQNYGIGMYGEGGYIGIQSFAKNTGVNAVYGANSIGSSRGETYGIYGEAQLDITGNLGTKIGVFGYAKGGLTNYGVYGGADTSGAFANTYAGYFNGDIAVTGDMYVLGNISKGAGTFKIDHPLDPENKYLYHSFVESPDMMNVYNGNTTTDANGVSTVQLPDYFEALNKDFRYQLTAIGGPAQVWIEREVSNNQFVVKSSVPNVKISWQVTGIRKDDYANAHRIIAEVEKSKEDKGKYLYPLEAGKEIEKGIQYKNIIRPSIRKRN